MIQTKQSLLRVVYLSRNAISMSSEEMKWEIDGILEQSQRNNALVEVTGALVFNLGVFGQVLEGPMDAVEETFDRIQGDARHHDVTVLELRRIEARTFPEWSMGFVGLDDAAVRLFGGMSGEAFQEARRLGGEPILDALQGVALKKELRWRAAA